MFAKIGEVRVGGGGGEMVIGSARLLRICSLWVVYVEPKIVFLEYLAYNSPVQPLPLASYVCHDRTTVTISLVDISVR